jgi:hypothetical protein
MPAGNTADLAIALQAAKGTAASASQHRTYTTGGGVAPMRDVADIEETSGSRLRSASWVQNTRAEGSPQIVVRPKMVGLLLYGALGAKSVSGAADPWTHVFTPATTLPWLTVWRMLASALFEKFTDCKVVGLHFSSEAGGLLQVTADILGLTPSYLAAAEATAAVETTDAMIHADGSGQLSIEGTPTASIETFQLDILNNGALQQGDSVTGYDVSDQMLDITWTSRQSLIDFQLWNRFHYGDATPTAGDTPTRDVLELGAGYLDYKFERPGTPERSLRFQSGNRVQVQSIAGVEPNTDGAPLKYDVTYKVYLPTSGAALTATLMNGQATYPAL